MTFRSESLDLSNRLVISVFPNICTPTAKCCAHWHFSMISALRPTYLIFNLITRHFRLNSKCPPLPLDPSLLKSFRNININEISSFRIEFFPMSPNSSISSFFILFSRCREE